METLVEYELQLMDTKEIVNRGNFVGISPIDYSIANEFCSTDLKRKSVQYKAWCIKKLKS